MNTIDDDNTWFINNRDTLGGKIKNMYVKDFLQPVQKINL